MFGLETYIQNYVVVAWIVLIIAFVLLAKCADIFVDCAVAFANKLKIPKLIVGLVLVSFATTAPELSVSLIAAFKGNPEMALGNAIGSVICDDGLALALAGICSIGVITVMPRILKISGIFLLMIEIVTFIFIIPDYTLSRLEGIALIAMFAGYLAVMFKEHKEGKIESKLEAEAPEELIKSPTLKVLLLFVIGLLGIILASKLVVASATSIAISMHIPESIIALTIVAFGTSIPEIATCVIAARKGHGDIAVGNIIGADILNICWVAGASAIANNLTLQAKEVYFMFPSMFVIVLVMLIMLRYKHQLTAKKGWVLLSLYLIYLTISFVLPWERKDNNKNQVENKTKQITTPKTAPSCGNSFFH